MKIQSILSSLLLSLGFMPGSLISAEMAPARLLYSDGSHDDALLVSYSAGIATYKSKAQSLNLLRVKKPKLEAIYFYEPEAYTQAMRLYRARNYAEAKAMFAKIETDYKAMDTVPNNYASLAGFYKMECSRRMNDLEALSSELEKYRKNGLTRETHLEQLEVYTFWEAVRLKDWARLDRLAKDATWQERKISSGLRVQIEYCHALALDHLAKEDPKYAVEALNAYSRVMSADATASIELVLAAAQNLFLIYAGDKGVQLAIKNWQTEDENRGSVGYQRLMEANTLLKFYKQAGFDKLQPLAAEHEKFSKYGQPNAASTSSEPTNVTEDQNSEDSGEDSGVEAPAEEDGVEGTPAEEDVDTGADKAGE